MESLAVAVVAGQAAPKAVPQSRRASVAEVRPRSVVDNLVLTNKAMVGRIKDDVAGIFKNPLGALGRMLKGFALPFTHPVSFIKSMAKRIKDDPVDGGISAASTLTGLGWFLGVAVAGLCVAAAPFTGGVSLAAVAPALTIGNIFAAGCIAADAAGIVVHQVRGAMADSDKEAIEAGQSAAEYLEDEVLNVAAWVGSDALANKLSKFAAAEAGRAGTKVASEGLGFIGVYDVPGKINKVRPH
jgi:hypothetical protein